MLKSHDTSFRGPLPAITIGVLIAHALVLTWAGMTAPPMIPLKKNTRQVVVKTVSLQPAEIVPAEIAMVEPQSISEPVIIQETPPVAEQPKPVKQADPPKKKTSAPPKKSKEPPPKKKKEPPPAKKSEVKKQPDDKQQELFAKARESIAKIGKNRDNNKGSSAVMAAPKKIDDSALPIAEGGQELSSEEAGYRDEVAGRLRLMLRLPDYGEVKIRLTLNRNGTVNKVVIVSSGSSKNRSYVETTVPGLKFPGFGNYFKNVDQYTFLVTLQNE